jgi:glycerate 2-kinase
MKIVIAPDSFKESLAAADVAAAIEAGLREIWPHATYVLVPMADGGEGTVAAVTAATGGRILFAPVTGPMGTPLTAAYGLLADGTAAVLEMASASGLEHVPLAQRNPLLATSFGTGELIRAALDTHSTRCILGIGGSATVDGGAGMLQALGAHLLDAKGRPIGRGGAALAALARIDLSGLDARLRQCRIEVACDVDNPLTGPRGAAAVFGPQKGATPAMVAQLEDALGNLARVIASDLGVEVAAVPGAGAAGGMGAALIACLNAKMRPGVELIAELVGLEEAIRDCDLVITGEGRIDEQTIRGKTPIGVAAIAKRHHKPVIALAGSLLPGAEQVHQHGIDAIFSVLQQISTREAAFADAASNLRVTARNIAAVWEAGSRRHSFPR